MGTIQLFLKAPLINPIHHSPIRPLHRVYQSLFHSVGLKFFLLTCLSVLSFWIWVSSAYAGEEELSDGQARQQCFKGKTIYCIALGIKEENSGHLERALELYRTACKKHSTPGHLRACTPLLSLARKMNVLNEEVAPLKARCRDGKGDNVTCFYLGKEYLKLTEIEEALRYLEPLCKSHFRSPTEDDHGPCYHLARGYEQAGQWNQARAWFRYDCENHSKSGQPSCAALKELERMERVHRELAQQGIRGSHPIEDVLLFIVLISVFNVWTWFKGGKPGLRYLSLAAPLVVWGAALTWVYWPEKPVFPASQWAVIYFSLLQVSGMAVFAILKLRETHDSR